MNPQKQSSLELKEIYNHSLPLPFEKIKNLLTSVLVLCLLGGSVFVGYGSRATSANPNSTTTSAAKPAEKCRFTMVPDSLKVEWTAYKTTQRVGVTGSFTQVDVTRLSQTKSGKPKRTNVQAPGAQELAAESIGNLLKDLKVNVDGLTVNTGNPDRDKTLSEFFFAKMTGTTSASRTFSGQVTRVADDQKSLNLSLSVNGVKKDLPMDIEMLDDELTATGTIQITEFSGQAALKSLSEKCHDLHKGSDGVSKTWPDVMIKIKGKLNRTCTPLP